MLAANGGSNILSRLLGWRKRTSDLLRANDHFVTQLLEAVEAGLLPPDGDDAAMGAADDSAMSSRSSKRAQTCE